MNQKQIVVGETYLFVATTAPARKHLEGELFTVVEKKAVYRRLKKGTKKVNRYFNSDGFGARPEELEPMDQPDEAKCTVCVEPVSGSRVCSMCQEPVCDRCLSTHALQTTCVRCYNNNGDGLPF